MVAQGEMLSLLLHCKISVVPKLNLINHWISFIVYFDFHMNFFFFSHLLALTARCTIADAIETIYLACDHHMTKNKGYLAH